MSLHALCICQQYVSAGHLYHADRVARRCRSIASTSARVSVPARMWNTVKLPASRQRANAGWCSMARTNDPNSANSQFFICLDDARFLDKQYTVWGRGR